MVNKKKSTNQKKKAIILTIIIVIVVGYGSIVLFGSHGLITLMNKKAEKDALIYTIKKDSLKNEALKNKLDKIKNDPDYIEKVAREKYNMQKPGEKVYQIEKKDSLAKE